MSLGPTLETERLILRPPIAEDFGAWADFAGDEEAARYLGGAQPRPVAWRGMCTMTGAWTVNGFSMFSVVEKVSGDWVGRLGPWKPDGWPGTEVGWGIARAHWGKGYAPEGAAAAIDWAFDHLGWTKVIHNIDPGNVNSQNVARRLGSTILRQALLPPPLNDTVDVWGQTRDQWRARRA
ncbi:GNAT family N-acetyltransferase [Phenylobacterium sp.]|uniref:GNAT family N-acetyltransferase n=1 Tax=Phenylobacterium sp. TaxID=1871053 RepID=UPI00286CD081|nr:GNAT family N-acetyltransferase [Phenylobacterium sp.]